MTRILFYLLVAGSLIHCTNNEDGSAQIEANVKVDPLPSWTEGATKSSILQFVESVSNEAGPQFVPKKERIAVFDNDGTLWAEKPYYFQLHFAIDRLKEINEKDRIDPNSALHDYLGGDLESFSKNGIKGLLELVMHTHAGITTAEFEQKVTDWIATSKHPTYDRPFTDLVYLPMLELIDFLHENDFKVFIISAGGIDFMRPWAEEAYDIPRERMLGSSIGSVFTEENGTYVLQKQPTIDFIDDKEGKPVGIHKFIGRRPILSVGNSDGDLQMMQWTEAGNGPSMMLYVHHTDSIREWAYDRNSFVGRFNKGLDEATEKNWTIVDMSKDWETIFSFQKD